VGSAVAAFGQPWLGILPVRDDPDPGVEIRYVYPKGPAATAGLKAGDRIMKVGPVVAGKVGPLQPITGGRNQLLSLLEPARPGTALAIEVKRKAGGKTETVTVTLAGMTGDVPDKVPDNASAKKALTPPGGKPPAAPPKAPEKLGQLVKQTTPAADNTYYVYLPENYDPNISCAVLVWLHPAGKNKERDFEDFSSTWNTYCDDHNIILVCPKSDNPRGWTPGEADFVQQAVNAVAGQYTVDRRRIVIHGMGIGGGMAYFLGYQSRPLFRGVATVGAAMHGSPREKVTNQPLSYFLAVGAKDLLLPGVTETKDKLVRNKYTVTFREVPAMGHEYLDGKAGQPTLEELVRWIDALDRL